MNFRFPHIHRYKTVRIDERCRKYRQCKGCGHRYVRFPWGPANGMSPYDKRWVYTGVWTIEPVVAPPKPGDAKRSAVPVR